tara:strand:- start:135 stop:515 length:381 start_codon:yes stop_codon:yes gene_type:complete
MKNKSNIEVALTKCFFCGEDSEIVINKTLTSYYAKKVKEMHSKVINKKPCNKCQGYMKKGIIVISTDKDKTEDEDNPYRTGGFWVIKDRAVKEMPMKDELKTSILKTRIMFLEHNLAKDMGLFSFA